MKIIYEILPKDRYYKNGWNRMLKPERSTHWLFNAFLK